MLREMSEGFAFRYLLYSALVEEECYS